MLALLQSQHPLALAGGCEHSDFLRDTLGRLRNTTAFIGRTTYAPRAAVQVLHSLAPSIRDAIAEGGRAWHACRRTGADYADLFRWDGDGADGVR